MTAPRWQWAPLFKWLSDKSELITTIATVVVAVAAIIALKQLSFQARSLAQAVRPIGYIHRQVEVMNDSLLVTIVHREPEERKDRFRLKFMVTLKNIGPGVLVPKAVVVMADTSQGGDFIEIALKQPTSNLDIDITEDAEFLPPIPPGAIVPIPVEIDDLAFDPRHYVHIALFYTDIDGKYYATAYVVRFTFDEPFVRGERLEARVIGEGENHYYHTLTRTETRVLKKKVWQK